MTKAEKELIEEKFGGLARLMNAHFENVHADISRVEAQTIKTNGRVTELEKKDIRHYVECPNSAKIRTVEDNQLTMKNLRNYMYLSVGISSSIITVFFLIYNSLKK